MKTTRALTLTALLLAGSVFALSAIADGDPLAARPSATEYRDNETTRVFKLLGKNAIWTKLATIPMSFPTFHTQGLIKIGDTLYASSVEMLENSVSNGTPTDSLYDFSIDLLVYEATPWINR